MGASHPVPYSFREYIAHDDASSTKHEQLDGQIYAMAGGRPSARRSSPPSPRASPREQRIEIAGLPTLEVGAIYEEAREPNAIASSHDNCLVNGIVPLLGAGRLLEPAAGQGAEGRPAG